MHRLRGEPNVRHHGNACVHQRANAGGNAHTTFYFDGVGTGFPHHPGGAQYRLLVGCLISTKWEVCHHQCLSGAPDDAPGQRNHFVQRYFRGGLVTVDDVRGGVPNQKNRNICLGHRLSGGVIVGGKHRPF